MIICITFKGYQSRGEVIAHDDMYRTHANTIPFYLKKTWVSVSGVATVDCRTKSLLILQDYGIFMET